MKCSPKYDGVNRIETQTYCNSQCFHWKACLKELHLRSDFVIMPKVINKDLSKHFQLRAKYMRNNWKYFKKLVHDETPISELYFGGRKTFRDIAYMLKISHETARLKVKKIVRDIYLSN